ncbi:hypothetical protein PFISCL1PPCAC_3095 [Pristionchus fissidentatus]|uniref:Globin domain-containing protein n=1 Tax=Pristionchus fissidentatus TaxID=1538716 RepID=A0AAV5V039_9BILA|nr:hypothetical protein PFISCL1PPCAC_3095 [Pristionchus fissidentatus]
MTAEVARLCKKSMESVSLGTKEENIQHGRDYYKFLFTNYPELRIYFKGVEHYTAEDVQTSERFEKGGARALLAAHLLAETFENQQVFKAYVRETINHHRVHKMDPALWLEFFTVFVKYLETKTAVNEETKEAWAEMGRVFNAEAQAHLKNLNLPHV